MCFLLPGTIALWQNVLHSNTVLPAADQYPTFSQQSNGAAISSLTYTCVFIVWSMELGMAGVTGPCRTNREVILCQDEKVLFVSNACTSIRSLAFLTSTGPIVAAFGGTLAIYPD